jgi:hypothetical protein
MSSGSRAIFAVVLAALVGSGVFVALLPWGDACSFNDPPGVNCAARSALEENLWNVLAILLPVIVGAGAALAAGSRRHAVGAAAGVFWMLGSHFGARLIYGGETTSYEPLTVLVFLSIAALLGLVGGHVSGYVVRCDRRVQPTLHG